MISQAGSGLTCEEMVELMTEHMEGTLSRRDQLLFDQHLEDCDGCSNYLGQMRVTVESLGSLRVEQVPEPLMQQFLEAFRYWRKT